VLTCSNQSIPPLRLLLRSGKPRRPHEESDDERHFADELLLGKNTIPPIVFLYAALTIHHRAIS
jgi:hypothetical protein